MRSRRASGVRHFIAREIVIDADADEIPVGIDGEAVMLPTPVRCTIQPLALRVRVPRQRPGVPAPTPQIGPHAAAAPGAEPAPRERTVRW